MGSRLWTKDFVRVTLSRMFSSLVFSLLTVTVAYYTMTVYSASINTAGVTVGLFIIAAVIGRLIIGPYTESIGRRRVLLAGSVFYFLTTLAYFLPVDIYGFMVIRILHGVAFGVVNNTMSVIATSYIPAERMGEGFGYFLLSSTLATAFGPFIGVSLIHNYDPHTIFIVCAVFSTLSLAFSLFINIEEIELPREQRRVGRHGFKLSAFFESNSITMSVVVFLLTVCYLSVSSFLYSFGAELGLEPFVPWYFIVYAATMLFSRPLLGKLMDTRGENIVIYPAIGAFIFGLVLLVFCRSVLGLLLSSVFLGIGYGGILPCCQAIVIKSIPAYRVGVATSTYYAFLDGGTGLGPMVMGALIPLVGFSGMYYVDIVIVIGTGTLYHFMYGRRFDKPGESP